jgi:hypothetical protein
LLLLVRAAEARIIKQQLDVTLSVADIWIQSSCFCRLGAPGAADKGTPVCHR